jgi:integrase
MAEVTIYDVFHHACQKAGLKPGVDINGVVHSGRRSALSAYGKQGTSLGITQQIAGHSNPLTTRHYQQFNDTDLLAAAKKRKW